MSNEIQTVAFSENNMTLDRYVIYYYFYNSFLNYI